MKTIKISKRFIFLITLLCTFNLGSRLYILSLISTKGSDIQGYEKELAVISRENDYLREQISKESSLDKIKVAALNLGMQENKNLEFLTPTSQISANKSTSNNP